MRRKVSKLAWLSGVVMVLASGCTPLKIPDETTDDGLVRVVSRSIGGVYRDPDATFTQYRRLILEPPSISFKAGWAEKHPDVGFKELARLRAESIKVFRDEFTREFVTRGPYEFADEPAADVLLVVPSIEELDIKVPGSGMEPSNSTYLNTRPVTMKVTGDLRDALTGKVIGRVIYYHSEEPSGGKAFRRVDRSANVREQNLAYEQWTRLAHEALSVAKTVKPRAPQP
jgi:hypothetical protein